MDSDGLHDEAERLARAHPQYGWAPETHTSDWQPQHAVPRHRKPAPMSRIDLEYIERRVQADLDRLDRELDPQAQAPSKVFGNLLDAEGRTSAWIQNTDPLQDVYVIGYADDYEHWHMQEVSRRMTKALQASRSAPAKQRKPKTYVTPGRKQGKTWIARLNQSKEARNAHKGN